MFDDLMHISLFSFNPFDYVRQKTKNGQKSPIFAHHPFFYVHSHELKLNRYILSNLTLKYFFLFQNVNF